MSERYYAKFLTFLEKISPTYLIGFTALMACWIIYMQRGWVTEDSILYYEMARLIASGDWQSAIKMYSWPLYPALIALTHKITFLSFQHSGNVLSVLFFTTTAFTVSQITASLGGSRRAQMLSVMILLGSRYITGDIMPMSTRDQGYWAMMSLAIWQLIVFHQQGQLRAAILWQAFAIMGTLFRIEGAVLLMALPWVAFFMPDRTLKQKQKAFLGSVSLLITGIITGIILLVLLQIIGFSHIELSHLGRAGEIFTGFRDIANNINQNLVHRVEVMRDEVIGEPFKEFAWFTFLLSLFSISVVKCLFVAGWAPPLLSTLYGRSSKASFNPIALRVLLATLFTTWITGCLIIFKINILSGRYVVLFGLVLVTMSALILDSQLVKWPSYNKKQKVFLVSMISIILAGVISNVLPKKSNFTFEMDAVSYVKQHLNANEKAIYTSYKQRFYAGEPFEKYEKSRLDDWEYLTKLKPNNYEFILLNSEVFKGVPTRESYLIYMLKNFKLDKVFYGYKNKKQTLVFKNEHIYFDPTVDELNDHRFMYEKDAVSYVKNIINNGQKALYTSYRQRLHAHGSSAYEEIQIDDWEYLCTHKVDDYDYVLINSIILEGLPDRERYISYLMKNFKIVSVFKSNQNQNKTLIYKRIPSKF